MSPKKHLVMNMFLGAVFLKLVNAFNPANFLMIIIGGIIFDVDHFIYHVFSEKNFSIKEFARIHRQLFKTMTPRFYIFHTFEFIFVFLLAVYFYFPALIYLALGFLLHMISDIGKYIYCYKRDFSWIKHWSLLWNLSNLRTS